MRRRLLTVVDVLRTEPGVDDFGLTACAETAAHERRVTDIRTADADVQMRRKGVLRLFHILAGGTERRFADADDTALFVCQPIDGIKIEHHAV